MRQVIVGLVLGLTSLAGLAAAAADEPAPKKLTPEERKEFETRWRELLLAGIKHAQVGKKADAAATLEKALAAARRLYPAAEYPNGHEDLATTLMVLAHALAEQGKHEDAERLCREGLKMLRQLFPQKDHPLLAMTLNELGDALQAREKYAEAEPFFRDALAMRRRLHPRQDHPLLAQSVNNLALVLKNQSKLAEAEPLFREALEMTRRLFPRQDHPHLATSINSLAHLLTDRGKEAEAEPLYREALALRRRLYPKQDHADLAQSLHGLAIVLRTRNADAEAEPLAREALAMRRRLYSGQDHSLLVMTMTTLAYVLKAQGKEGEAEPLCREALQMCRKLYPGRDHPLLASSVDNLAGVLSNLGKRGEAELLYREALAIYQRLYPQQDHAQLAEVLNSLAMVLPYRDKAAEAEDLAREALAMSRRLSPNQDQQVARSLVNLAFLLQFQGKDAAAGPLCREAVAIYRRLFPNQDHPQLANSLNGLAFLLQLQGKDAEAEALFREALAMQRRLYPSGGHPELARNLTNLALVLQAQGKGAEAEMLYRDALRMSKVLAGAYAAVRSEGEALTLAATLPRARDGLLSNARTRQSDPAEIYAELWTSKASLTRVYEGRALAARAASANSTAADLLGRLTDLRRHRADLLLSPKPADPVTQQKRDDDLAACTRQIEKLDQDLRPLLPAVERAEKLARSTPTDLQKVLPADAAVVDFLHSLVLAEVPRKPGRAGRAWISSYLAFVLTRDQISWVDLGRAEPIEEAVAAWREAITRGKEVPPALAAQVRELVWNKVQQNVPARVKMVYLCPDLALCRVPWAALPGIKPGTILLEDYAVAVLPHAGFLLDRLWSPDGSPIRLKEALVVGGVAYDADLPAPPQRAFNRGGLLLHQEQAIRWASLPGAAAEAQGIIEASAKNP
jgi:tetratricopeptide (TPR) repeat protein